MERGKPGGKSVRGHSVKSQWSPKASQKSKSSTSSGDPKEQLKDICRKAVEFTFTQVGVGGLVITYAVFGAWAFMFLEEDHKVPPIYEAMAANRSVFAKSMWDVTRKYNNLFREEWGDKIKVIIREYEINVVRAIKENEYDPNIVLPEDGEEWIEWPFSVALMYTLSVFTMIGYGRFVPKTDAGKIATMCYAVLAIPMYVLYLNSMGRVLAGTFRWLYIKIYTFNSRRRDRDRDTSEETPDDDETVLVPSGACIWVMVLYIAAGTTMFTFWEKDWGILNSAYFCVTSLCKIGMGDFVPGAAIGEHQNNKDLKLVMNFIFLLLGMGLVAMCYILLKDSVHVFLQKIKTTLRTKAQQLGDRIGMCREHSQYYERSYYRGYSPYDQGRSYERGPYDRSLERPQFDRYSDRPPTDRPPTGNMSRKYRPEREDMERGHSRSRPDRSYERYNEGSKKSYGRPYR